MIWGSLDSHPTEGWELRIRQNGFRPVFFKDRDAAVEALEDAAMGDSPSAHDRLLREEQKAEGRKRGPSPDGPSIRP